MRSVGFVVSWLWIRIWVPRLQTLERVIRPYITGDSPPPPLLSVNVSPEDGHKREASMIVNDYKAPPFHPP
jgi:hypothetical protein